MDGREEEPRGLSVPLLRKVTNDWPDLPTLLPPSRRASERAKGRSSRAEEERKEKLSSLFFRELSRWRTFPLRRCYLAALDDGQP